MKKQNTEEKYDGWLDFIVQNFIPGTATTIAKHIELKAREESYKPNNKNVRSKVRQILPEHSGKTNPKVGEGRKIKSSTFLYKEETSSYYLTSDFVLNLEVKTNEFNRNTKVSGEKITIETPKDKTSEHNKIVELIQKYATDNNMEAMAEAEDNIDLLIKKDDMYSINEVKTYKNSIYTAVGQVQYYKYRLITKYGNINMENIHSLNIVGNFELDKKFKGFLESLNIKYINYHDFEKMLINF